MTTRRKDVFATAEDFVGVRFMNRKGESKCAGVRKSTVNFGCITM